MSAAPMHSLLQLVVAPHTFCLVLFYPFSFSLPFLSPLALGEAAHNPRLLHVRRARTLSRSCACIALWLRVRFMHCCTESWTTSHCAILPVLWRSQALCRLTCHSLVILAVAIALHLLTACACTCALRTVVAVLTLLILVHPYKCVAWAVGSWGSQTAPVPAPLTHSSLAHTLELCITRPIGRGFEPCDICRSCYAC